MPTAYAPAMTSEPGMPVPDHYLSIPQPDRWLNSNDRSHRHVDAAITKTWRTAAATYARAAKLPPDITPVRIIARLSFPNRAQRDPGNWYPTAKAIVDGLRDAGVLADDTAAHVIGPDMRLGPTVDRGERGVIVLEMWRLDPAYARRSDTSVTRAGEILPAALSVPSYRAFLGEPSCGEPGCPCGGPA